MQYQKFRFDERAEGFRIELGGGGAEAWVGELNGVSVRGHGAPVASQSLGNCSPYTFKVRIE